MFQRIPLILLFLPLIAVIWLTRQPSDTTVPTGKHTYRVRVMDNPIPRDKTWRHDVMLLACADTLLPQNAGPYRLYIHKDSADTRHAQIGDTLLCTIRWNGNMGFARQWIARMPSDGHFVSITESMRRLRHYLINRYRTLGIHGAELQTTTALTLGYREELDKDLRLSFQRAGAAHILAVSGMHTGILYMIIINLLTLFGRRKPLMHETGKRWALCIGIIGLMVFYALLTGMTPSVVRSVLMLSLLELGAVLHRPSLGINTLLAAAIIILTFRPSDLWAIGFWLSFTAVAALMLFAPNVHGPLPVRWTANLLIASFVAQVGTLPLCIYCFGQTSNYFLLTNLLVVPLAMCLLSFGLATLTLGFIPGLGTVLATVTQSFAHAMNSYVTWVESLPGAVSIIHFNLPTMLAFYAVMLVAAIVLRHYQAS